MKGFGSRNTASMKSPEGPGTSQFRAGFFGLGLEAKEDEIWLIHVNMAQIVDTHIIRNSSCAIIEGISDHTSNSSAKCYMLYHQKCQ
ncbi:unnamed protein product [Adineta ricciae]|uniref:Uncharacterized protein n=1 Tax=Adineta ricciae TaxID=249248 RepID=A0A813VN32_ADIRI|nr:unnamed protein product [Adineta ricciae]